MRTVMVGWFSLGEGVVIFQLCPMPCGVRRIVYTAGQDVGMPYYRKESIQDSHRTFLHILGRCIHGCGRAR